MELAIKGHTTRGKEVIALLEMLGGRNVDNLDGNAIYYYYTIMNDKKIIGAAFYLKALDDKFYILSLEEFLEKFPYKVGDKVIIKVNNQEAIIDKAVWCCDTIIYWLKYDDCLEGNWRTEHLQPYKEETMEEKIQAYEVTEEICANEVKIEFDPSKFEIAKRDNGYYVVKKQPQYPKTYKECCEVLMGKTNFQDFGLVLTKISTTLHEEDSISPEPPHITLINNFYKLLICRDAYWKISGDWKPNLDSKQHKFAISNVGNKISFEVYGEYNSILCFPTEEMRNAFYENFKDLITECKELL